MSFMPESQPSAITQQIQADILAQINQHQQGDHARPRGERGHGRHGHYVDQQHFNQDQDIRASQIAEHHSGSHGHTHKDRSERRPANQTVLYAHADATKMENHHPLKQDVPLYTAFQDLSHISSDRIEDATITSQHAWNALSSEHHTQSFVDEVATLSQKTLKEVSLGDASAMTHITGMKENHALLLQLAPKETLSKLKKATTAVIESWNAAPGQASEQSLHQLQQVVQEAGKNNAAVMTYAAIESTLLAASGVLAAKGKKREALALLAVFTGTLSACVPHVETPTSIPGIQATTIEKSIESVGASFNIITADGFTIPTHITAADCLPQTNSAQPVVIEFAGTSTQPARNLALCNIDLKIGSQPDSHGATLTEIIDGQVGNTYILFGNPDSEQRQGELVLVRDGQAIRGADTNMAYQITTDPNGNATAMTISNAEGTYQVNLSGPDATSPYIQGIIKSLGLVVLNSDITIASPTATPEITSTPTATATATEIPLPLYWQCGPKIYTMSYRPVTEEAMVLPTGLINGEFTDLSYLTAVTARACLTKINDVPDPLFPNSAVRSKVIFFDLDGKTHEYTIMIGGEDLSGGKRKLSVGTQDFGSTLRFVPIDKALSILETYYNNPDATASKQVDIDFDIEDRGAPWILGQYINQYPEITGKLVDALKTGRGFPEDVPEDYFLYVSQILFMPGFTP